MDGFPAQHPVPMRIAELMGDEISNYRGRSVDSDPKSSRMVGPVAWLFSKDEWPRDDDGLDYETAARILGENINAIE